jgi:hypothetical protein
MVASSESMMRFHGEPDDASSMSIIRGETVLSKFPIHNLAKAGKIEIQIIKRDENREASLKWEVSYNERYGQPRQLAYKLDTLYINRKIDEAGRPVPRMLCLGSLRDIAKALNLGADTNLLKKAIRQNASAFISAKLSYKAADGAQRTLEADFTRYSVIFTGERLPGGERADAVYLVFNNPFWEVLNNAPIRPLNYDYLKELTPAAQRCYEIISYWIYAAIKFKNPHAKIAYSDYCAFSAQHRYFDYDHVKKQMYKVHRAHIASGYLTRVKFEETTDAEGKRDWMMFYTPGPKARAEYEAFNRVGDKEPRIITSAAGSRQVNEELVEALSARGVLKKRARKLLAELDNDLFVLDQIEYVDHIIAAAEPGTFKNPPGFYIYMIFVQKVFVPFWFESSTKRRLRAADEEAARVQQRGAEAQVQAYGDYVRIETERQLAGLSADERRALYEGKKKELLAANAYMRRWNDEMLADVIHSAALAHVAMRITVPDFEEFCAGEIQETRVLEPLVPAAEVDEAREPPRRVFQEPLRGEGARDEIARILREGSKQK